MISSAEFPNNIVLPVQDNTFSYENKEYTLSPGDYLCFKILLKISDSTFKEVVQYVKIPQRGNKAVFNTGAESNEITSKTIRDLQGVDQDLPFYFEYLNKIFVNEGTLAAQKPSVSQVNCPKGVSLTRFNRNEHPCKGDLIFEDQFNNLDSTKWKNVVEIASDDLDADFVSFQKRQENIKIEDGNLHILPTLLNARPEFGELKNTKLNLSGCTAKEDFDKLCVRQAFGFTILPPIVSAKIHTRDSFSFKYGRVVVRAKVPKGDWLFPLITLEPTTFYYGSKDYHSGQIRIASVRGNEFLQSNNEEIGGRVLYGGPILDVGEQSRDVLKFKSQNEHYGDSFHEYEVVWTPNYLRFLVDGVQYGDIKVTDIRSPHIKHAHLWYNGGALAPFDKEFHLSLGLSAGGLSDFPDNSLTETRKIRKPWVNGNPNQELVFWNRRNDWFKTWDVESEKSRLIVDYVKVYALDE